MKKFNYWVLSLALFLGAVFAPVSSIAIIKADSTKVTVPSNVTPKLHVNISHRFKNSYINNTNGTSVNGVDTRNGSQNPTANGCANPYTIVFNDGSNSIKVPYTGKYLLQTYYVLYQNQDGAVTVNMEVTVNNNTVDSRQAVLVGGHGIVDGNGLIQSYNIPIVLSLKSNDVIRLVISNGPCSQAYILVDGKVSLTPY